MVRLGPSLSPTLTGLDLAAVWPRLAGTHGPGWCQPAVLMTGSLFSSGLLHAIHFSSINITLQGYVLFCKSNSFIRVTVLGDKNPLSLGGTEVGGRARELGSGGPAPCRGAKEHCQPPLPRTAAGFRLLQEGGGPAAPSRPGHTPRRPVTSPITCHPAPPSGHHSAVPECAERPRGTTWLSAVLCSLPLPGYRTQHTGLSYH